MWSAGGGKGRKLSRGWKKKPIHSQSMCVSLFFFFSFLCCKDEIQMAQINAERHKNESIIAGDARSYFFSKKPWELDAIVHLHSSEQFPCLKLWDRSLSMQDGCKGRTSEDLEPQRGMKDRRWALAWLALSCTNGTFREKSSCCKRFSGGHSHPGHLHPQPIPPSTRRGIKAGWDGSTCDAMGAQGCCGDIRLGLKTLLDGKPWAP